LQVFIYLFFARKEAKVFEDVQFDSHVITKILIDVKIQHLKASTATLVCFESLGWNSATMEEMGEEEENSLKIMKEN
jgi:hypothetical protein